MARERGIRLAGCMAHLRRKLRKAHRAHDPRAVEALALIGGLYRVEKLARLRKLDAAGIVSLRQERSVPFMDALVAWAHAVAPTVEPGSPLGEAWTYFDNQHAFLRTDAGLRPGDLVSFGISHPCTAFDKWRVIPVVDSWESDRVVELVRTYF